MTRLLGAGLLLGVLAVAGTVAPASAATGPVPVGDEVAAWFSHEAAEVIAEAEREPRMLGDDAATIEYAEVEVGRPVTVEVWTDAFRAGSAGSDASEPIEQWIAPVFEQGEAVGTVSAFRDGSGAIGLAYYDDAAMLATGLQELRDDQRVVYDAPLDAFFALDDTSVAPLSESSRAEIASEVPLDAFRRQLEKRYASESPRTAGLPRTDPRSSLAGGGASVPTRASEHPAGEPPAWTAIGLGLAALSAGTLALSIRRRPRPVDAG